MHVINVGKWDISKEIVSMMVINLWMVDKNKTDHLILIIQLWEGG